MHETICKRDTFDPAKLTPAPWNASRDGPDMRYVVSDPNNWIFVGVAHHPDSPRATDDYSGESADSAFISLARNAFDVMMRRNWHPELGTDGKWHAVSQGDGYGPDEPASQTSADDPFSALVAADEWYKANVEARNDG